MISISKVHEPAHSERAGTHRTLLRRLAGAAMVLALALGATAIESFFGAMAGLNGVPRTPWLEAFGLTLPSWLLTAALVPAIVALAESVPIHRRSAVRFVITHLFGAAAFVAIHLTLFALWITVSHGHPERTFRVALNILRLYSGAELLTYATVAGVWTAVRFHREALAQQRDAAELSRRLVEARLDALRLQLQPHFLFNTLQAVSDMARARETDTLVRVVANLGDLLRAVLDDRLGPEVTLAQELALLGKYLDIQYVRFRDRLVVRWSIDDDCRNARVPSLILQPLVENAMVHGIDARPGPGEIRIGATRIGDRLRLTVEDSGPGLAPEPVRRRSGVGLANTRARLEHRYGERMSLEGGNGEGGGARFVIEIPFEADLTAPAEGASTPEESWTRSVS